MVVFCYTENTMITFITGNAGKWKRISAVLGDQVVQKDIDLVEIQSLDVKEVIAAKLIEARKVITEGAILVDESGYYFHAFGRLPGVFTKFFLKELSLTRIVVLLTMLADTEVTHYSVLGYMNDMGEIRLFRRQG